MEILFRAAEWSSIFMDNVSDSGSIQSNSFPLDSVAAAECARAFATKDVETSPPLDENQVCEGKIKIRIVRPPIMDSNLSPFELRQVRVLLLEGSNARS